MASSARFWDEDRTSLFKELYPNTTNADLAKIFGVSVNAVEHMATKYGLRKVGSDGRGQRWTEDRIQSLISLYPTTSNSELASMFSCSIEAVQSVARRLGLRKDPHWRLNQLRSQAAQIGLQYGKTAGERRRKTFFNEAYFSPPLTNESAYWLGFIQADGCLTDGPKYPRLVIKVALRDASHLDQFLQDIKCNRLAHRTPKGAECRLSSAQLVSDLMDLGVRPRKGQRETFAEITGELFRHYLRGVFDGDGWVSSPLRKQPAVVITGSHGFVIWALEQVRAQVGISGGSVLKDGHASSWNLCITGRYQVEAVYRWLYDGATRWLPRKRERFQRMFEVRRENFCD